jgi:hypothetical protein
MTLINEKLKGFFDLENFDPSLSSLKKTKTIKSHQAKNKKRKTKNSMENRPKQPKLKNLFMTPSFWPWEILSARKKKKKKKLKTGEKAFDFEPFCQEKEKPKNFNDTSDSNQDFCPINFINQPSKKKNQNSSSKTGQNNQNSKTFFLDTFILTLGDSISLEKKKKRKKKKLKTSEKTFVFEPFCQEKEKPNF